MDLRALIISNTDNAAPERVRSSHQSAVTKLTDLLNCHNVATELLDVLPYPSPSTSSTADIVFIFSPMTCWYPGLRRSVASARHLHGNKPIILVETVSTLSLRHTLNTSGADYVHKGEIGEALGFILKTFGYRLRRRQTVVFTL